MEIRSDLIRELEALSRLELEEGERERMVADLGRILEHVSRLEELDLEKVPPTSHVLEQEPLLREDEPAPGLPPGEALAAAWEEEDPEPPEPPREDDHDSQPDRWIH